MEGKAVIHTKGHKLEFSEKFISDLSRIFFDEG